MARAGSQARAWRVAWSAEALSIAPQRGAHSSPLRPSFGGLRASLAASRPRLWRSTAGGATPPRPPGLRPLCAFAHGHPLPVDQAGGVRAVSGSQAIKKRWAVRSAAGGSGGVPPVSVERWATRKWPVGGQGAAARLCPPSTGHRVVHGGTGSGHMLRIEREGNGRKPAPVLDPPLHFCIPSPALVVT